MTVLLLLGAQYKQTSLRRSNLNSAVNDEFHSSAIAAGKNRVARVIQPAAGQSIGELGICGAAPAIVNAIYNACGVRVGDLPLTSDKEFEGLQP